MFILLTNSLHCSCTEFKFLSRPGMMALALAHIRGSSHPINLQTESFIGHAKKLLPGFKGVQDVFTTTTFPQKHSTIFVVTELKKKKGRRKETLGNVGEEDHRKWGYHFDGESSLLPTMAPMAVAVTSIPTGYNFLSFCRSPSITTIPLSPSSSMSLFSSGTTSTSPLIYCGRGDKKTAKGKRFNHSFGNARPRNKKKGRGPPRVPVPPAPPRKDRFDDGEVVKIEIDESLFSS
ncbi:unnamed protein product [Lactuca saligna]|uniref:30S ribosomal protein S31, chloroplastic n=1 Tax=Lactuca saligna TaxID=75948 RepID=A0AA35YGR2_LACSI|nr:unnamed protein product [Lactuca saligna]